MKNAKRIIAIVMAAFILCQGFAVVSAEDGTAATPTDEIVWTYDNSIIVTIRVDEAKVFTPDDFSEVGCVKVLVISKIPHDTGYEYELMLILDASLEKYYWETAAEDLLAEEGILYAERNYLVSDYGKRHSYIDLTQPWASIQIGESVDIEIVYSRIYYNIFPFEWIEFKVDPEIIDENAFTKDYFAEYGIRFWPQGSNSEGAPSENHWYKAIYDPIENGFTDETGFDAVNEYLRQVTALANVEGVKRVELHSEGLAPGSTDVETWLIDNEDVATLDLSGGYIPEYHYTPYDQTATVTGIAAGEVTLTCQYTLNTTIEGKCRITVYDQADVNNDGSADSLDAAYMLKYDAGLIGEEDLCKNYGVTYGDVNLDGARDSLDGALILRRDAGL